MWWYLPYTALVINLIVIWLMPKRLTILEIYVTWFVVAMINLSTDIVLSFYFRLYELAGPGLQLSVHFIEWTLAASYSILYLNFLPRKKISRFIYIAGWLLYAVIFEAMLTHVGFINYSGWKLWYSAPFYLVALLFMLLHLVFIRSDFSRRKRYENK